MSASGSNVEAVQIITIDALADNTKTGVIQAAGSKLFVVESDRSEFEVSIDGNAFQPIGKGITIDDTGGPLHSLQFRASKNGVALGATLTARLVVGNQQYKDSRFAALTSVDVNIASIAAALTLANVTTLGSITNTVTTKDLATATISPSAVNNLATASSLNIAASAGRRYLAVYNGTAGTTVWFRDQGGTTAIGIPVFGGGSPLVLKDFTGAARIRNESGSTCDIYVTEITA